MANGARLAVLIDTKRRAVEVYAPGRDTEIAKGAQTVSLDAVLPGFSLNLAPIFE